MKTKDKSIRVSAGTYKALVHIKEQTGKPIKRIVNDAIVDLMFNKKRETK